MPAAGEIHRLKKRRLPAGFLAGDESVKHNGQFNSSLSRLNVIFSRQPNFLATTLTHAPSCTQSLSKQIFKSQNLDMANIQYLLLNAYSILCLVRGLDAFLIIGK